MPKPPVTPRGRQRLPTAGSDEKRERILKAAEALFDRSLLAATLAISRDVAISEGDALSPSSRRFISDAGGGEYRPNTN